MGCVYSRDERPKSRPQKTRQLGGQTASRPVSATNRGGGSNNRPIQVKNTVKREASSQPTVTQVEKVKRSESTSPTSRDSGVDVASNTALNQTSTTTTMTTAAAANLTSTSLEAGNDLPFRRQHFDRNSVLRHSKKRRKSSSAGQSSVNNTPVKHNNSTTSNVASPTTESTRPVMEAEQPLSLNERGGGGGPKRSLLVEHGTIETKKESSLEAPVVEAITKEQVHPLPNSAAATPTTLPTTAAGTTIISSSSSTVSKMETFSASANVAALLGKPILQKQQPPDAKLPKTTSDAIKPIG